RGGSVAEPLLNALRYRRLLLLLDNLEHLPGAADHLAPWLRSAPGLSLLVTSQHRARLQGEQSVVVPPLALPTADTPPERLPDFAAVALFLAVARRTLGETAVPPHTATHVAHICRLLDGNPLAIELAAARSHLVPPDVMLAQLRRHTHLLETRAADVPARHRSLQAAIQWSVDLLDAAARQLFVRLALFPHGFSPAAVTAVLLDRPVTHPTDVDPETLNRLEDLFDKHLIVAADDNRLEGELRFTMLTTLHGFAHALLAADPALPDLQAAYVRYYAWLTQETSRVARGRSTAQGYSLDRIRIEEPNILAALHWAVGPGQDGRLSPHAEPMLRCLQLLWRARLRYAETVTWVQRTLAFEAQLTPHARATLLSLVSYAAAMQADYANAVAYVEDAYALARQLEDGPLLAAILSNYGTILSHAGDNDRAVALLQEALSLEDSLDTERRGVLQHNLAVAQLARGRFAEGIGPAQEAIGHYQATGQDTNAQDGAMLLADLYLMNGQHAAAAALLRESFAAAQAVGNQNALLSGLSTVADHLFRLGEQAAEFNAASLRLHSASHSLTQQAGFRWPQYYERIFAETLSTLRTRLGHEAFVTAWTEGTRLTMPEAIPFALTALAATRPPLP
ncbi:MAG: tetratricopeptide repeat protein, partial [Anaerolineales bacterium]|nr:tetratricopeptide repeat protein [Anaerolineales bacterium]